MSIWYRAGRTELYQGQTRALHVHLECICNIRCPSWFSGQRMHFRNVAVLISIFGRRRSRCTCACECSVALSIQEWGAERVKEFIVISVLLYQLSTTNRYLNKNKPRKLEIIFDMTHGFVSKICKQNRGCAINNDLIKDQILQLFLLVTRGISAFKQLHI